MKLRDESYEKAFYMKVANPAHLLLLVLLASMAVSARAADMTNQQYSITMQGDGSAVVTTFETASLSVTPTGDALRLLSTPGDACSALTLRAPGGKRDLSAHRFVEFILTNSGQQSVEFTLWALSPGGWSGASTYPMNTKGRVVLKPGAGGVFPVDLWAHFPGPDTFSSVVDPSNIDRLRIVLQRSQANTDLQLDLYSIRVTGDAPRDRAIREKGLGHPQLRGFGQSPLDLGYGTHFAAEPQLAEENGTGW